MPFKAYTPFELGEIAYQQGFPIETNPFKKIEGKPRPTYNPDYHQWELGYLVAKAAALVRAQTS